MAGRTTRTLGSSALVAGGVATPVVASALQASTSGLWIASGIAFGTALLGNAGLQLLPEGISKPRKRLFLDRTLKWHVAVECFRHGLYWRGLLHDWHKMRPGEWLPYTNYFYGEPSSTIDKGRDGTGYYKAGDTGDAAFDFAWLLHQKRADHHWQWWVLPEDDGGVKVLPMSAAARLEMLCDWAGASRAQGHGGRVGVLDWYKQNAHKMQLHRETRGWVEGQLKQWANARDA